MKNNNSRFSLKTIGVGASVLCLVLTAAAATPAILAYVTFQKAREDDRQKVQELLVLEKDAKGLQELLAGNKKEREELAKILFNDQDIATFLNNIVQFAHESNVKIVDMKAKEFRVVHIKEDLKQKRAATQQKKDGLDAEKGPQLSYLPISIAVKGQFERLIKFLLSLQEYRQLLTIGEISIRRHAFPELTCQFTLRLYSLKDIENDKKDL